MSSETKTKLGLLAIVLVFIAASEFEPIRESIRQRRVAAELQSDDRVLAATAIQAIRDGNGQAAPIAFGRPSPNEILKKLISEAPYQRSAPDCLRLLSMLRAIGTAGGKEYQDTAHGAALLLHQELVYAVLAGVRQPSSESVTSVPILAALHQDSVLSRLKLELPSHADSNGYLLRVPYQALKQRASQIAYFNEDAPLLATKQVPLRDEGKTDSETDEIAIEVHGRIATRGARSRFEASPIIVDNPSNLNVMVVITQKDELYFVPLPPMSFYEVMPDWRSLLHPSVIDGKEGDPADVVVTVLEWKPNEEEKRLWISEDDLHPSNRILERHVFVFPESLLMPELRLPAWYLYSVGGRNRYSFGRVVYHGS